VEQDFGEGTGRVYTMLLWTTGRKSDKR